MTPKTFPKYVSKIKKLALENNWSQQQYEAALEYLKKELDKEINFTPKEYNEALAKIGKALSNPSLNGQKVATGSSGALLSDTDLKQMITGLDAKAKAPNTAQTAPKPAPKSAMSMSQLMELENQLVKQLNAGTITSTDYLDKMDKLQEAYTKKASYDDAKTAAGLAADDFQEKIKKLNELAQKRGQSLASMAIAWVLRQDAVTSALIGASRITQITDVLDGLSANPAFAANELAEIDAILK